jgi:ornithine carbamoyltransferase
MINLKEKIYLTIEDLSEHQLQQVFNFASQLKQENIDHQDQDNHISIIKEIDGVLVVKASENQQLLTTETVNEILEELRGKY